MTRRPFAAMACLAASLAPAIAVVSDVDVAAPAVARHLVLVVGSRSTYCSGVALKRDLVLAAAHCVQPAGGDYMLIEAGATRDWAFKSIAAIARHPEFQIKALLRRQPTADVALLRPAAPLPAAVAPAPLAGARVAMIGDRLIVAGYGVAVRGDGQTGGAVRSAILADIDSSGMLRARLIDSGAKGAPIGMCTGDSGAPVFAERNREPAVVGLVSWSAGPDLSDGCGSLAGLTPLALYRDWIVDTAASMGSPLP
jgi:hypothetical protein